jgi:glycosyltransferase involved in cell wall biosynthesis
MKILHLVGNTILGGTERLCELFIRYCPEFRHDVVAFDDSGPAVQWWRDAGATVLLVPQVENFIEQWWVLRRLVSLKRPQAVISWSGARIPVVASAVRCAKGSPLMVTSVGNPLVLNRLQTGWYRALSWLPHAKEVSLAAASHYIFASVKRNAAFRNFDTTVVPNAVDLARFAFRCLTPSEREPIRVGMISRMDEIKDQETLLRSWPIVRKQHPTALLELIGDGPRRLRLQSLSLELGLEQYVRFHGSVQDPHKVAQFWHFGVHSTTELEGFGIAAIELMAMGKPLVATDVGAMREVSDNGRYAKLVAQRDEAAMADAISNLIGHSADSLSLANDARAWVERQYHPRRMVERYLDVLQLKYQAAQ